MDAQKISEAASTIKKANQACEWLNKFEESEVRISTVGNSTHLPGHSEVQPYLKEAFEVYRELILETARKLAVADKATAEIAIREQAAL